MTEAIAAASRRISGRTRVVAIIGHPTSQVRSPTSVNAEYARRGIDAVLVPIDLEPVAVPAFLEVLRHWRNAPGCVVTVPHKSACAALVDGLSERARRLGAVNLIRRTVAGRLEGDMVDGEGFMLALRQNGFAASGKAAIVFGAGAVGRALLLSLGEAGVSRLVFSDPDAARIAQLQTLADEAGLASRVSVGAPSDLGAFDLAVNASPVGMGTDGRAAFDPRTLPSHALVADVVTDPVETPLLRAAKSRGLRTQHGLAMSDAQVPTQLRFFGLVDNI
jgi:shikimate dehydrogenase